MTAPFAAPHESANVLVFGRRRITNDVEHSGPAYENRQRTKPRGKVRTAVPRSAYQRAPEAGFLYNLSVTARRLLNGGKQLRRCCSFNGLSEEKMAKMRQFLTCARMISKASVRGMSQNPTFARAQICVKLSHYISIHPEWRTPRYQTRRRGIVALRIVRPACRSALPRAV
jgi:hypothetical protein